MTLRTLRLVLLAPLAALFLNIATPSYAHDGRAARADRIEDRIDRRHDHGRLDRIEDRIDRRTGPGRVQYRTKKIYRSHVRPRDRYYRKRVAPRRYYKRYRKARRPHFYFRW